MNMKSTKCIKAKCDIGCKCEATSLQVVSYNFKGLTSLLCNLKELMNLQVCLSCNCSEKKIEVCIIQVWSLNVLHAHCNKLHHRVWSNEPCNISFPLTVWTLNMVAWCCNGMMSLSSPWFVERQWIVGGYCVTTPRTSSKTQ